MKFTIFLIVWSLVTVCGFDLAAVKLIFCEKLKAHWAYDRLMLKYTCLEMAKQMGSEHCLDVTNIFCFLFIHLSSANVCTCS